jgi:hypothetical protein
MEDRRICVKNWTIFFVIALLLLIVLLFLCYYSCIHWYEMLSRNVTRLHFNK